LVTVDQFISFPGRILLVMKAGKDKTLLFRCPTCGAKPGEKCELNSGTPRSEPHPARSTG
jgi:hypothetical protein